MSTSWVDIGSVRTVNPVKREVRVRPLDGFEGCLDAIEWLHVRQPGGKIERCKVVAVQGAADVAIILAPGVPRDTVRLLLNGHVVLEAVEAEDYLSSNETFLRWPGMTVYTTDGTLLGTIGQIYTSPHNGAFTVECEDGKRLVLPAIDQVVQDLDVEKRTLTLGDYAPYAVEE